MITLNDIQQAHQKITPYIFKTPQIFSSSLSKKDQNVYLKLESMQITGSFKLRGASNKLLSLSEEQKGKGVVAVSTGNHGKAVAYAAKKLDIKSKIFMSDLVPTYRRRAIEALGAEVIITGKNSDEADNEAHEYVNKNNVELIHPFDDEQIIAGQGTIGLEMLESLPFLDTVIVPTSGGGLIGGIAVALKQQKPDIPRRMKQAVARHARKMDKEMKTVLDDDQYKLYEQYRTLLTTKTGRMFSPSRTRRR